MLQVLLIDDEPAIRMAVGDSLHKAGHQVTVAADGAEGLSLATSRSFDVVITDVRLPRVDGNTIFHRVHDGSPATEVILMTAFAAIGDAVTALKDGAHDYLVKPIDLDELVLRLERIDERRRLRRELDAAKEELQRQKNGRRIIGRSPAMVRLVETMETIATSDAPVLITGESGTGKDLVAQTLHSLSPRRDEPFVAVNCAAFPETLLEAELFGHERGAFTGAVNKREGRFKAADHGTLFLDEIAEIPPAAQAKLLRVLENSMIEPLGTNTPIRVDVRVIAATHQNLKQRIADKLFREDLYYRLNVLDLHIPPLRERMIDLPLLVEHFMHSCLPKESVQTISLRAWSALSAYSFPGNVRELQHAIERACVLANGAEIDVQHLPEDITGRLHGVSYPLAPPASTVRPLSVAMKEFEREYLIRTLSLAHGKRTQAASLLGITRKNLWEKLRAHGVGAELAG